MNETEGLTATANDGINNPLNIRATNIAWEGKITKAGANFEAFQTMWQGYRAGMKNVLTVSSGRSFNDTIPILSPATENNIPAYIAAAQQNGVDTTVAISDLDEADFKQLIANMAKHEQGDDFTINEADIDAAYDAIHNNG